MDWGTAIAGITGAIAGRDQTGVTNAMNLKIAREDRAWQERMSNTAYQRAVNDMEEAGLNPAQMLGGGGQAASTPTPSTPTMTAYQPDVGDIAAIAQAATDTDLKEAEIANLEKQTGKTQTEIELNKIERELKPKLAQAEIQLKNANTATEKVNAEKLIEETITNAIDNFYLQTYGSKGDASFTQQLIGAIKKSLAYGGSENAVKQVLNNILQRTKKK